MSRLLKQPAVTERGVSTAAALRYGNQSRCWADCCWPTTYRALLFSHRWIDKCRHIGFLWLQDVNYARYLWSRYANASELRHEVVRTKHGWATTWVSRLPFMALRCKDLTTSTAWRARMPMAKSHSGSWTCIHASWDGQSRFSEKHLEVKRGMKTSLGDTPPAVLWPIHAEAVQVTSHDDRLYARDRQLYLDNIDIISLRVAIAPVVFERKR